MEQRDYWDSVSNKKEFTVPLQDKEFSKYVNKDALIVDIGCGYGRTLNELSLLGYSNLMGFDFSEGMIERGKKQFPELNLKVKTDDRIDLPDDSVDAVILFAVLTCIVDNDEQEKLISEIYRVLKPDGILYVNDYLLNQDERNLNRYKQFNEKYGCYGVFELPEGALVRHHSEDWIRTLLKKFSLKEYDRLTFTTMNGNKSNGFFFIGTKK